MIDYLIKVGSERCIDAVRDHIHNVRTLMEFTFVDSDGVDQGLNGISIFNFAVDGFD